MKSEQDRVIEIMRQMNQGNAAGRRLRYSEDLRRIVPVDESGDPANTDPDNEITVTPKDMEHFCFPGAPTPVIVLSGDSVGKTLEAGEATELAFHCYDNDTVFSALGANPSHSGACGTIELASSFDAGSLTPTDAWRGSVHVVLVGTGDGGQCAHDAQSPGIRGYVRRGGRWEDARVVVTPVRDELFSRTKGIIETGVLAESRVAVFGVGSGGSFITWELAKQGIMHFALMDYDRLEVGNVVRHMAGLRDVGRLKTDVLKDMILDKNPYAEVQTWSEQANTANMEQLREIVRWADVVVIATDNQASRLVLNQICVEERTPCMIAATYQRAHGGQVLRVRPHESPCYQCFLSALPTQAMDQEIASPEQAERVAYADRPVAVEAGLSADIAPISLMVVKLVLQELLRDKPTTLRSLDEDLTSPWYFWLNRREQDTEYARLTPLADNVDGMHVLRWYGVTFERNAACPCCGDYLSHTAAEHGVEVTEADAALFEETATPR